MFVLEVLAGSAAPRSYDGIWNGAGSCRSKGHKAVGIDIDPLAVLISRVWTTSIDAREVKAQSS